ncbi:hypothetical protein GMA8713_04822 [Grimontia marina]|uniref:Uncharacterized protein n=1 Tax=Grimontia marina TaxID=646534 RepID=A0A128FJ11_9GAMM|nr:hypothetical protein GMA8713_04822 [Grimontia marina]
MVDFLIGIGNYKCMKMNSMLKLIRIIIIPNGSVGL